VSSDGPENSNSTREAQFEALGESLVTRSVMVHALILSSRANVGTLPALIASSLTQSTGGYFQSIYTTTAVPDRLREIADEIVIDHQRMNSWYQVDFRTDTAGQGRLIVGLRRPNIRLDVSSTRPRER